MKPVIYTWGKYILSAPNDKVLTEPRPYVLFEGSTAPTCNRGTVVQGQYAGKWIWYSDVWYDWSNAFKDIPSNGQEYQIWLLNAHIVENTDYMFYRSGIQASTLFLSEFGARLKSARYMFAECTGISHIDPQLGSMTPGILNDVTSMFDHNDNPNNVPSMDYDTYYRELSACSPQYYSHCFRGCPNYSIPASWS